MSHHQILLEQNEPLEGHEINDLKEWLRIQKSDCEIFGEAPEDATRIKAIQDRLKLEEMRNE